MSLTQRLSIQYDTSMLDTVNQNIQRTSGNSVSVGESVGLVEVVFWVVEKFLWCSSLYLSLRVSLSLSSQGHKWMVRVLSFQNMYVHMCLQ